MSDATNAYWLACATGNPPKFFTQDELFRIAGYDGFTAAERRRIQALFRASAVSRRAIWITEDDTRVRSEPDHFIGRYFGGVREITPPVARKAVERAGLGIDDIDFLVFASCTGYSCPAYSVELAQALGMGADRPTASILGMGCSGLGPALRAGRDFVVANPGSRALVVASEICSATYWIDGDLETAVGNALFGDGSAAIVLSSSDEDVVRAQGAGSSVASIDVIRTLKDGRYLSDMGFTQSGGRLRLRLAREVPERMVPLAEAMMKKLELEPGSRVAMHPGGRRILDMIEQDLMRESESWKPVVGWARGILRDYGNMSSPTVVFVLERSMEERPVRVGEQGALLMMGPGMSVEAVKMTWLTGSRSG